MDKIAIRFSRAISSARRLWFTTPNPYRAKRLMALAALCCCALLSRGALAAGLVFSDNFESGTVKKWTQDGKRNLCQVVQKGVDGSTPHGGQQMAQCNWNGTVDWNAPTAYSTLMLPPENWPYNQEFLLRLWIKYDHDVSHTFGGKVLRFHPDDELDGYYLIAQMQNPGGPGQSVWESFNGVAGPTYWGAQMPLGDHSWHKLEIYVKASTTATGIARVWFDGVLVQEVKNTVTVAPGKSWGPLFLMSNWSNNPGWEHGANNHIYWDDVQLYTDTGSGGSGNLSDASIQGGAAGTAPNAPASVQVH
jgi:hypothetical protein